MTEMGLGCAKTPAPAAHVETSRRNCAPWSRIVLRARCSIPCWRIVFSTFRNCMSFHTGWVKNGADIGRMRQPMFALPEIGHGVYSRCQFLANAAIASSLSCARILFRLYSMPKDSHTRQGNCHEITSDRGFFVSFDDQPSQYSGLL